MSNSNIFLIYSLKVRTLCGFQAVRKADMITVGWTTLLGLTTQNNKRRNGVYQNEEGSDLWNARPLWLMSLHGNIFLPQSNRGVRRYAMLLSKI